MSESKKRNVHLPEFKAKVVLEALRGMKTISQIAQESILRFVVLTVSNPAQPDP